MVREGEGRGGKGAIETKRRPLTGVTPSVADPFKQTHGVAANLRWTMRPREHGPDCFIDPNFYFGEQIDGKNSCEANSMTGSYGPDQSTSTSAI